MKEPSRLRLDLLFYSGAAVLASIASPRERSRTIENLDHGAGLGTTFTHPLIWWLSAATAMIGLTLATRRWPATGQPAGSVSEPARPIQTSSSTETVPLGVYGPIP